METKSDFLWPAQLVVQAGISLYARRLRGPRAQSHPTGNNKKLEEAGQIYRVEGCLAYRSLTRIFPIVSPFNNGGVGPI